MKIRAGTPLYEGCTQIGVLAHDIEYDEGRKAVVYNGFLTIRTQEIQCHWRMKHRSKWDIELPFWML